MMKNSELYFKAADKYGLNYQLTVAIEELSELQKELTKYIRNEGNKAHLIEEVADVEIVVEQIRCFFELGLSVEALKKYKLERLEKRLEEK